MMDACGAFHDVLLHRAGYRAESSIHHSSSGERRDFYDHSIFAYKCQSDQAI